MKHFALASFSNHLKTFVSIPKQGEWFQGVAITLLGSKHFKYSFENNPTHAYYIKNTNAIVSKSRWKRCVSLAFDLLQINTLLTKIPLLSSQAIAQNK